MDKISLHSQGMDRICPTSGLQICAPVERCPRACSGTVWSWMQCSWDENCQFWSHDSQANRWIACSRPHMEKSSISVLVHGQEWQAVWCHFCSHAHRPGLLWRSGSKVNWWIIFCSNHTYVQEKHWTDWTFSEECPSIPLETSWGAQSVVWEQLRAELLFLQYRNKLKRFGHLSRRHPGRISGEVFWACPTGGETSGHTQEMQDGLCFLAEVIAQVSPRMSCRQRQGERGQHNLLLSEINVRKAINGCQILFLYSYYYFNFSKRISQINKE